MKTASLVLIGFLLLVWIPTPAVAQTCGPETLESGTIRAIGPGADLHLGDGRILRLAGLHNAEGLVLPLKTGDAVAFGVLGEPDRWARHPAIVFHFPAGSGPVWLQQHLAATGAAVIRPEPGLGGCWTLLRAVEASHSKLASTPAEPGRFARIEGRVSRVSEGRSAHFVTVFDWDGQRITGLIQKRYLRRLQQGGVDVAGLKGHIVRLRGVRSLRNARVIALTQADQIEIVR